MDMPFEVPPAWIPSSTPPDSARDVLLLVDGRETTGYRANDVDAWYVIPATQVRPSHWRELTPSRRD